MKPNKELREDFFKLIDEFNTVSITKLAKTHARQIPYIELLVLEKACLDYIKHEDDRSIRALVDAGFQMFAVTQCYGSEESLLATNAGQSGFQNLFVHWMSYDMPPKHFVDLFDFIYESQYEDACQMFAGGEPNHFGAFNIPDKVLTMLKSYHFENDKYPDFVCEIENDETTAKEKFQNSPPHVKFRLAI